MRPRQHGAVEPVDEVGDERPGGSLVHRALIGPVGKDGVERKLAQTNSGSHGENSTVSQGKHTSTHPTPR